MDIEQARFNMIEQQIRPWDVLNTQVLDVIQSVPREQFVPEQHRKLSFADLEIPLGHGQAMMSPKVEARILQALDITSNDRVFEVGTGSGFLTACLASMAQKVTTTEYFADLSDSARQNCEQHAVGNYEFIQGNVFDQLKSLGSYDVIAVTASIPEYTPQFAKHLCVDGRLFIVVGQRPVMTATLVTCVAENEYRQETLFETELAPLVTSSKEKVFSF